MTQEKMVKIEALGTYYAGFIEHYYTPAENTIRSINADIVAPFIQNRRDIWVDLTNKYLTARLGSGDDLLDNAETLAEYLAEAGIEEGQTILGPYDFALNEIDEAEKTLEALKDEYGTLTKISGNAIKAKRDVEAKEKLFKTKYIKSNRVGDQQHLQDPINNFKRGFVFGKLLPYVGEQTQANNLVESYEKVSKKLIKSKKDKAFINTVDFICGTDRISIEDLAADLNFYVENKDAYDQDKEDFNAAKDKAIEAENLAKKVEQCQKIIADFDEDALLEDIKERAVMLFLNQPEALALFKEKFDSNFPKVIDATAQQMETMEMMAANLEAISDEIQLASKAFEEFETLVRYCPQMVRDHNYPINEEADTKKAEQLLITANIIRQNFETAVDLFDEVNDGEIVYATIDDLKTSDEIDGYALAITMTKPGQEDEDNEFDQASAPQRPKTAIVNEVAGTLDNIDRLARHYETWSTPQDYTATMDLNVINLTDKLKRIRVMQRHGRAGIGRHQITNLFNGS